MSIYKVIKIVLKLIQDIFFKKLVRPFKKPKQLSTFVLWQNYVQ